MKYRCPLSLALVVAGTTLTGTSFAQDESGTNPAPTASADEDEQPRPKMDLSVAPPPENPLVRTDYVHEGFYFRFNVGAGFVNTTLQDKILDSSNNSTAFSLGTDLLIGGSPSAGMALGGGVVTDMAFAPEGPVLQLLGGPFFDVHPYAKGGWHLGTMVGFAGGSVAADDNGGALFGGGASAWGGADIWAAPEWSVGFNLRILGAHIVGADSAATNFSTVLLITVLNH